MDLLSIDKASKQYERFINKITINNNGCWIMSGFKDKNGYAAFHVSRNTKRAHRVSYEIHKGTIPKGLTIDHLCCTPACVNPEHLEAVPLEENIKRAAIKRKKDGTPSWMHKIPKEELSKIIKKKSIKASETVRAKQECRRGHAYTPENTKYTNKGNRICKICLANCPSVKKQKTPKPKTYENQRKRIIEFNKSRNKEELKKFALLGSIKARELALAKTSCKKGHPWQEETTYYYRGSRRCRLCAREVDKKRRKLKG